MTKSHSNVVALKPVDRLDAIADEINIHLDGIRTETLQICILASEARTICHARGQLFSEWARDRLNLSKAQANNWARIGDQPDPRKALEDFRSKDAERKRLGSKPPLRELDDDEDDEEISEFDTEQARWKRGLIYRAESAAGGALYEDWSQFEADAEIVEAVRQAAAAWTKIAAYVERLKK